jgi:ubiquinone/menaquinone biosynthesis C-methylase UbiE
VSKAGREAPAFEEFRAFERSGWNRVASRYEATFGRCTSQAIEPMLDAAGVRSGSHVLDLACGPGFAAAAAMRRGATAAALDLSPAMVALATANCRGADVREGEAGALPWPDATFDCLVSNFGVNHFPDVDRALLEMRRVLKRNGRLAFTVWEPIERSVAQRLLHEAIAAEGRLDVPLPASPAAHRFADETEVKHALGAAGFRDIATRSFDVPLTAPTPGDVFAVFREGTVRLGAVLQLQSEADLSRIGQAFERSLAPWTTAAGVAVPMRLALTSARAD